MRLLSSLASLVVASQYYGIAWSRRLGHPPPSPVTLAAAGKCKRGATPAVIAGKRTCLVVGQRWRQARQAVPPLQVPLPRGPFDSQQTQLTASAGASTPTGPAH